jgi:predicted DNA-binding protein
MLKTYLYIPDELNEKIKRAANAQKKSKAEVIRKALEKGINEETEQGNAGVELLFKLAELGEKANLKGPRDGSVNHDYYLWGLPKRK